MNQIDKEIKKIKVLTKVIFGLFVILVVALFWFFSRSYFVIVVAPTNATVTVDNNPIQLNHYGKGSIYSKPGTHEVKIQADGYIGVVREITFKRGLATNFSISLKEMPRQQLIEQNGKFLTSGRGKNEFIYLTNNGNTLQKATLTLNSADTIDVQKEDLTGNNIPKINDLILSPNNDLALFKMTSEVVLFDFQKYDFVHQTISKWGDNIGNIAWAPDNSKVAYYYTPPTGEKSIIFSSLDNSTMNRVLNINNLGFNIENPVLHWSPDSRWLLIVPQSKDYNNNKIYLFDAYSNTLKNINNIGDQIDAKFSPDGKQILYSTYSFDVKNNIPTILSVMDLDGSNVRSLNLRADISKTIWTNDSSHIIVSSISSETNSNHISVYDTKNIKKDLDFLSLPLEQKVLLLQVTSDDKIVVYQTNSGIYASRLEE